MFHLALHTIVTGTREGAADFYAVNGGNDETSGPLRAEYSVALQLPSEITAEIENSTRILPFEDRKSTRLNSSHSQISYAVFCLKKKNQPLSHTRIHTSKLLGPPTAANRAHPLR